MAESHPKGTVIVDRKLGIVRHPEFSCGRACTAGWIGCIFIAGRHRAGESIASLAYDYAVTRRQVENAIAYINKRRKRDG